MRILDAPMGTRLIDEFSVAPKDVLFASLERPELVRALHRRDVEAGAEIVLTNTFALPFRAGSLSDAEIAALAEAAIGHAMAAGAKAVHISLGPAMLPVATESAALVQRVLTCIRPAVKRTRSGIWFESLSISDLDWLVNVTSTLASAEILSAACFIAGDEGDRLWSRLADLGHLWALGFNCSRRLPGDGGYDAAMAKTAAAWSAAPLAPGQCRVAKPAKPSPDLLRSLPARFDLAGVCCGGSSADLRALAGGGA